jgi:hypothetical protein
MSIRNLSGSSAVSGSKDSIASDGRTIAGVYELISTTTLTSDTASVSFSSLNTVASAYRHLRVVLTARAGTNGTGQSINLKINGDTSSIYNAQSFYNFVGTTNRTWVYINSTDSVGSFLGGGEGQTSYPYMFHSNIYEFFNFSSTSINKQYQCLNGCAIGDSSGTGYSNISFNNGMWASTAAITSITFTLASNFKTGSRFSLYGIRG